MTCLHFLLFYPGACSHKKKEKEKSKQEQQHKMSVVGNWVELMYWLRQAR